MMVRRLLLSSAVGATLILMLVLAQFELNWALAIRKAEVEGAVQLGAAFPVEAPAPTGTTPRGICIVAVVGTPDCGGCRLLARNLGMQRENVTVTNRDVEWYLAGDRHPVARFAREFDIPVGAVTRLEDTGDGGLEGLGISTTPTLVVLDERRIAKGMIISNDLPADDLFGTLCDGPPAEAESK